MKTTILEVVQYWAARVDESDIGVDFADAHERCWRCGYKARLQRCHIIPDSLGGTEEAANLVLLCAACHAEAPNTRHAAAMWTWIKATCVPIYDTYWTFRAFNEYRQMFGREPFTGVSDLEQIKAALSSKVQELSTHWGSRTINPATTAAAIYQAETADNLLVR